ncbi:hypothetical protein Sjap_024547 [Stephania japonica]|uniref:Wall-associated receptor kinase galacturonan-binding domain-containing protein n=1 Tax=Stephania japonica TaxID=461633 RepID=A0AAP0EFR6_9MAGN
MAIFLSLSLLLLLLLHSVSPQCTDLFSCRSLGDIGFPFANTNSDDPDCKASPFILNCSDNFNPQLQFSKQNKVYPVQAMNFSQPLIVVRDPELEFQLNSNLCGSLANFTNIPTSPLVQFKDVSEELTFLKCKRKQEVGLVVQSLRNYSGCVDGYDLYFNADGTTSFPTLPASVFDKCEVIQLPVSQLLSSTSNAGGQGSSEAVSGSWASAKGNASAKSGSWASAESRPGQNGNSVNPGVTRLSSLLKAEFSLGWEVLPTCSQCQQRGGTCSEDGSGKFQCRRKGVAIERHGNARRKKAIVIDLSIAVFAFILLMLLIWYCWSRKRNLHLEDEEDFRPHGIMSEEQRDIAMKMILVGLWCIQTNPSDRPSINRVMEMMEGPLQSIQTPPKPFLYSPERSPMNSTVRHNLESSEMMEGNLEPVVNLESGRYRESDSYVSC